MNIGFKLTKCDIYDFRIVYKIAAKVVKINELCKLFLLYLGSWRIFTWEVGASLLHHERIGLFHILNIYEFSWEGVRLPYQIIFLPNLILCSSLYLFFSLVLSFFHKKRYKPMVDSGCKKIQVKGDRRRSDGGKTKIRRGKDEDQTGKKYGRHTSSIFDSKGVGLPNMSPRS